MTDHRTSEERPMGTHRSRRPGEPTADRAGDRSTGRPRAPRRYTLGLRLGSLAVLGAMIFVAVDRGTAHPGLHDAVSADSAPSSAPASSEPTAQPSASASPSASTAALPPAPAGFADQLSALYVSMRGAATATSVATGAPDLPTTAQFDAAVDALSPTDLASVYHATQNDPQKWAGLTQTYDDAKAQASAAVAAAGGTDAVAARSARLRATPHAATPKASTGARSGRAIPAPPAASATATQSYEPGSAPQAFQAGTCPAGAPGANDGLDAIFATSVAANYIQQIADAVPADITVPPGQSLPNPGKALLTDIVFFANLISQTFQYLASVASDCAGNNMAAELDNIDNTTFDTYTLLSQIGQTTNEIDNDVAKLLTETEANAQQSLQLDIEHALAQPDGTTPVVAYELPAYDAQHNFVGGFLDAQPVGVQSVVTDALKAMNDAGQPVNPLASRTLIRANQALGAQQYKQAWTLYRQTYAYIAD